MQTPTEGQGMSTTTAVRHDHISDAMWRQLTGRVRVDAREKDVALDEYNAERVMGELVNVYLPLVDEHPGHSPSKLIDLAWHTFINHTRTYERYCHDRFGRFVHHEPGSVDCDAAGGETSAYALDFLREHGIAHDPDMWSRPGDCSGCADTKITARAETDLTSPAQCQ